MPYLYKLLRESIFVVVLCRTCANKKNRVGILTRHVVTTSCLTQFLATYKL